MSRAARPRSHSPQLPHPRSRRLPPLPRHLLVLAGVFGQLGAGFVQFVDAREGTDAHAMHDALLGDGDFLHAGFEAGKRKLGLEVVGVGRLLEGADEMLEGYDIFRETKTVPLGVAVKDLAWYDAEKFLAAYDLTGQSHLVG